MTLGSPIEDAFSFNDDGVEDVVADALGIYFLNPSDMLLEQRYHSLPDTPSVRSMWGVEFPHNAFPCQNVLRLCLNSFLNTLAAEVKLETLSEYILVRPGLLGLNRMIAMITELVSRLKNDSE